MIKGMTTDVWTLQIALRAALLREKETNRSWSKAARSWQLERHELQKRLEKDNG